MTLPAAGARGSRQQREEARRAAERAALVCQDTVLDALGELAREVGIGGEGVRIVLLHAELVDAADPACACDELREELVSATFACDGRTVTLTAADGPRWQWTEAASLWDELREALGRVHGAEMPPSVLVDLHGRVVACWDPEFCPDMGPLPEALMRCEPASSVDADPFDALLAAANDDEDLDEHVAGLLTRFGLTPPGRPAHEPGDCPND